MAGSDTHAPIAPGATIGILGGGQLGRMTALAAANLTGDVEKLNEASALLSEVQEGWTGIKNHREA